MLARNERGRRALWSLAEEQELQYLKYIPVDAALMPLRPLVDVCRALSLGFTTLAYRTMWCPHAA